MTAPRGIAARVDIVQLAQDRRQQVVIAMLPGDRLRLEQQFFLLVSFAQCAVAHRHVEQERAHEGFIYPELPAQ